MTDGGPGGSSWVLKVCYFALQPLQVMDPDHPLAALVRKAQQEKNGNVAINTKPEDEVVAQAPSAEYTTDRKYSSQAFNFEIAVDII